MKRYNVSGATRAYFDCVKKQAARRFIARTWRAFAGRPDLPADRQYWGLCGPMTRGESSQLEPGSELRQLSEVERLFKPEQFVGADTNPTNHRRNLRAINRTYRKQQRPHLYHGDVLDLLRAYQQNGELNASIVYLDATQEARTAVPLLRSTLNALNHIDGPTMVVWGVISERFHYPRNVAFPWSPNDEKPKGRVEGYIRDYLLHDQLFQIHYRHGWSMFWDGPDRTLQKGFRYESSITTQMSLYVFVRYRQACGEDCGC